MSKFLIGGGTPPSHQQGKLCINFANMFLYTMKKLHAHHIHLRSHVPSHIHVHDLCTSHVPKWPSYFCKILALCVSQIYIVYIFTCLFNVCNTINLSQTCLIRPNDGRSISQKEYLSLNIKHNRFVVYIYIIYIHIYIYIYIYI